MQLSKIICLSLLVSLWIPLVISWDPNYIEGFASLIISMAQSQDLLIFPGQNLNATEVDNIFDFIVQFQKKFEICQLVLTNRLDLRVKTTAVKKVYLSMVFINDVNDAILKVHETFLIGKRSMINLLILVDPISDYVLVENVLRHLRLKNFQLGMVLVTTVEGRNEMWGFDQFPVFKMDNRTDIQKVLGKLYKVYADGILDTEGYKFISPLRQDVPQVFRYTDINDKVHLQGISYKVLALFMEHINATIQDYVMPADKLGGNVIDMKSALDLIRDEKISILFHSYALFTIDDHIDKSFPIMVVKWCLMVPIWNSVSTFYYPIQPFGDVVWFAVALTCALLLFMYVCMYLCTQQNISFLNYLSDNAFNTFALTINVATMKKLQLHSTVFLIVFATIFFYGFFITANYTSLLGSILAVTIFRAQINTIEDLIASKLPVMIIDYELDFLLKSGIELPDNFLNLLVAVDSATFTMHQESFNSSYAYFVTDDKWHFLDLQQSSVKPPLFKFTDICFGSYHLAFPIETDSAIWRNLEYFIFRIHSSGLLQYYESTSFDYALHAGLMQRFSLLNQYTSAGLKHLLIIFIIGMILLGISFIIFLAEIIIYKLTNKPKNKTVKREVLVHNANYYGHINFNYNRRYINRNNRF